MSRRVAVLVLVAAALLVVTGSGGYSVTSADRDLRVGVEDDEGALLGVETAAPELRAGHHRAVTLVTLTNNFESDVTAVDADVKNIRGGPPPHATSKRPAEPPRLTVGESAAVTVDVTCGGQGRTELVDVDVVVTTAAGSDVKLTREVSVTCTGESNRGASGRGDGERDRDGADRERAPNGTDSTDRDRDDHRDRNDRDRDRNDRDRDRDDGDDRDRDRGRSGHRGR